MGHYLSEMEGSPFTSWEKLPNKLAKKILKKQKLKFDEITEVKLEWINPYSWHKRIQINIGYEYKKSVYCCSESVKKANKVISKKNKQLIESIIQNIGK